MPSTTHGGIMSFTALAWVSNQSCKNSINKLILYLLANYANEYNETYPSYKHLAKLAECSERTAMRSINELIELGLITKEKRFTDDGKQTSNKFILNIRGVKNNTEGVSKQTPNTIRDIQKNNKNKKDNGDNGDIDPNSDYGVNILFNKFWYIYPRKDGSKQKAFDYFKKLEQSIQIIILNKTAIFAKQHQFTEKKFIPHATTYLNQKRFETVENVDTIKSNKNNLAG